MLRDLVLHNRSYRRYDPTVTIARESLLNWVDLARLSPSSRNLQPLKYKLVHSPEGCATLFPLLSWAGYLPEWQPTSEEAPTAYIILLVDRMITTANVHHDEGIAAQSILLGAVEQGYGGCIIASIDRKAIREQFQIAERFQIALVIALGKPVEQVELCEVVDSNIKYFRDEEQIHKVPKRSLEELIVD